VAGLGCDMQVPCYDPMVMAIMDGVARQAYREEGREHDYKAGSIHYVSAQQFSYVAAVTGIMVRDRPAANVYMGSFYAESLFLAETGNLTGAIQIAGCDKPTQLPFFVCACDYTLLGVELFAAGAYIGREPMQLATIAAQDWAKALAIAVILIVLLLRPSATPSWRGFSRSREARRARSHSRERLLACISDRSFSRSWWERSSSRSISFRTTRPRS